MSNNNEFPMYHVCQIADLVAQLRYVRCHMVLVNNTEHLQYAAINIAIAEDDLIHHIGRDMDHPWQTTERMRDARMNRDRDEIIRAMIDVVTDVMAALSAIEQYDAEYMTEDLHNARKTLAEVDVHMAAELTAEVA